MYFSFLFFFFHFLKNIQYGRPSHLNRQAPSLRNPYLPDRRHFIIKISTVLPINYGVSQGSILGPLLFIVYNNDLLQTSTNLKPNAHDCIIYQKEKNIDIIHDVNKELTNLSKWLNANKFTPNSDKMHYVP